MPTFGQRFKQLRISKGLTQDELITEFNELYHYSLSKSAISQYENNKRIPEINALMDFASYFNISLDYLLCRDYSGNLIAEEKNNQYELPKGKKIYELTDILNYFDEIIRQNDYISLNGKLTSKKTIELIRDCLKIALELTKESKDNHL